MKAILKRLPHSITGVRDRAMLLIGFAGAFRHSELVALNLDDLAFSSRGVAITIRRSKTDQGAIGETIGIPRGKKATCPVAALEAWIERAGIAEGAIFRSINSGGRIGDRLIGRDINRMVKRGVALSKAIGL